MTEITLKSESRLEKILASGQFALTGELGPPKSVDVDFIRQKAEYLKGKVDAVNITDNQTAIVRMSSFAVALILKEMHLEPTMQITCRDRNRLAIQSDVLGAAAHGIHNILCLTGDHQCFGNHTTAKNVFDIDAVQLIEMLRQMRDEKKFANGEEIKNSKKAPIKEPRIFIGAAVNPFADPLKFRATRLAKKINAGVDFVQTQCIYDMERFNEWMKQVRNRGLHEKVKILAGVTPLKSVGMAQYMRDCVAGLMVPDTYLERLSKAQDTAAEAINICVEQIHQLREIEGIAGIHLMAIEWEKKVPEIAEKANLLPRPRV
ncbi:MAG: methylenetetrahydrofolate reductase [Phycisphaerae bacterium SM23_30]|nr:MAG: methylenetetrahydrofolate reductase [Phycisphaerae bacterium SM23_30]